MIGCRAAFYLPSMLFFDTVPVYLKPVHDAFCPLHVNFRRLPFRQSAAWKAHMPGRIPAAAVQRFCEAQVCPSGLPAGKILVFIHLPEPFPGASADPGGGFFRLLPHPESVCSRRGSVFPRGVVFPAVFSVQSNRSSVRPYGTLPVRFFAGSHSISSVLSDILHPSNQLQYCLSM